MVSTPLPTREDYISALPTLRKRARLPGAPLVCTKCLRPLARQACSRALETHVHLHDRHFYGEDCLREHLEDHNTCPVCDQVLFMEAPEQDDRLNLRRILNMRAQEAKHFSAKEPALRKFFMEMRHAFVSARAALFSQGKIKVRKEDYAVYHDHPYSSEEYLRRYRHQTLQLNAQSVTDRLVEFWEETFITTVKNAAADNDGGKVQIPCHPLSMTLLNNMLKTLWSWHGLHITPKRLEERLKEEWSASALCKQVTALHVKGELPQGFFIWHGVLVAGCGKWFTEL